MDSCLPIKTTSWWLIIGTILTYLCWFIVAGHGVIPMGLLLVLGLGYWNMTIIFGWAGIIFLIVGKLLNRFVVVFLLGIGFLLISWLIILWQSEEIITNIFTSIPFLICILSLSVEFFMRRDY